MIRVDKQLYLAAPGEIPDLIDMVDRLGGSVFGSPHHIRGGQVEGVGLVLPVGSLANDTEIDADRIVGVMQQYRRMTGQPTVCSAGSAALAMLRLTHPEHCGTLLEPWHAVMRDSVHAGPVEWRHRIHREHLAYLDQTSAYLRALEAGIPSRAWEIGPPGERLEDQDPTTHCVVADVTLTMGEPRAPRRATPWGPTIMEEGEVRTTLRTPSLIAALEDERAGSIVQVHGWARSPRVHLPRLVRRVRDMLYQANRDGDETLMQAAKGIYQRLWGKLLSSERWTGTVERGPIGPDGAIRSLEAGRAGSVRFRWSMEGRDPDVPYRPDIAGEIVSYCHAETVRMAATLERHGHRVALLHVDAVIIAGVNVTGTPDGWALKGQGIGSVYGHGRYTINDPDKGVVQGRMGIPDGQMMEFSQPADPGEAQCSSRRWLPDGTSVPWVAYGWQQHRSGDYPWDIR